MKTMITMTMMFYAAVAGMPAIAGTAAQPISTMKTISKPGSPSVFPLGEEFSNGHFTGRVWLRMLSERDEMFRCPIGHVTFEPGCRNSWHRHPGGQILLCTAGAGYFQEKGKPIRLLRPGDTVRIAPGVQHWHGASPDSWFSHLSIETNADRGAVEWLQPVTEEEYGSYRAESDASGK